MTIRSEAKKQIIDFLRKTKTEPAYSFSIEGDKESAEKFVHRMRVELARLRHYAKSQGRMTKHFKMILIAIKQDENDQNIQNVFLERTISRLNVDNEIDDIFNEVAGGDTING